MLELRGIDVSYGAAKVLRGFTLSVAPGEITCLMGRNGAGKTTAMKAIMGLLPLGAGEITMDGAGVSKTAPHKIAAMGIGYVPQGRRLFSELTVAQNMEIGLMARGKPDQMAQIRNEVLDVFPRLRERRHQRAQTLSGGEQQMLATARALCLRPDYLLLDEPTEGLQPSMIASIREVALQMKARGVGILLVEQRVDAVLSMADKVAFIENGEAKEVVPVEELRKNPALLHRYVGI